MVKEGKKRIDGKAFLAELDECRNQKEIFELLTKTMDRATLKDRVSHVNDNDLINALHAQKTRCNIKLGYRTSHEDCANLAAHRYQQITKKGVKFFKTELNKYMVREQTQENPFPIQAMTMISRDLSM